MSFKYQHVDLFIENQIKNEKALFLGLFKVQSSSYTKAITVIYEALIMQ